MASILQQPGTTPAATPTPSVRRPRLRPSPRAVASRPTPGRTSSPRPTRKLSVLLLVHAHLVPPADVPAPQPAEQTQPALAFQAELDVLRALQALGHDVYVVGLADDLSVLEKAVTAQRPDVVFNLIESFNNFRHFDQHVVSYLECLGLRYTGCNPRGLTLARDKSLGKKILSYHGVRVPEFQVFPIGRTATGCDIPFPALVKSTTDDGSIGIAKASVVNTAEELRDRVKFVHDTLRTDAIAEQYIEGRELYVGVWGNRRPAVLPVWELDLSSLPPGTPKIVTNRVKMDAGYQRRYAITSARAKLTREQEKKIHHLATTVYRELSLTGYARLDLRMTATGDVYFIEANPNPQIAHDEDFAQSAIIKCGTYHATIDRILSLALNYAPIGMA